MVFVPVTGDPVALTVGHAKNMIPMTLPECTFFIPQFRFFLFYEDEIQQQRCQIYITISKSVYSFGGH